jgi:DNA-binding NtrC family response regulator
MTSLQSKFSCLLVDDDPKIISLLESVFSDTSYQIYTAMNGKSALALMEKVRIDATLIDVVMPGMDGITLLKEIKKDHPETMAIMLSGYGCIESAVKAVKLGAVDFLEKPISPEGLRFCLSQLYEKWKAKNENRTPGVKIESRTGHDELVGNSALVKKLKQIIAQVGPTDAPVLIQGQTGTGKELVARAVYDRSRRHKKNFMPVDCAAISETVIESELFGHVKGAFTGAHLSTLGIIRSADKGTLFLDEIGELPQSVQAKLLRTIQEREVRPVGSSKRYPVDIRVIAATNRDLEEEVLKGSFNEALFYRLNVVNINVPPLKDRKEDIPLLARHFARRFTFYDSQVKEISPEALACLEAYDWPGNVRELENAIQRALALGSKNLIRTWDLPKKIYALSAKASQAHSKPTRGTLAWYEQKAIENALTKSSGNRKIAAMLLNVGEATIYRKIKKYHINV